jgi:DNA-directed RNA polymerase subunit RPC12/RpoP
MDAKTNMGKNPSTDTNPYQGAAAGVGSDPYQGAAAGANPGPYKGAAPGADVGEASDGGSPHGREDSEGFPCPSCGAAMTFDPAAQSLKCGHCGHAESIADSGEVIVEHDFATHGEAAVDLEWSQEQSLIKCESCGAETVLEKGRTASLCAFCGSPRVIPAASGNPGIKPESLLPFRVTRQQATEIFSRWLRKDLLAPGNLSALAKPERLTGIYTPSWTFDADTHSKYTAQAGEHYYVTETRHVMVDGKMQARTETVQKTHWYTVRGAYSRFFDDVTVSASKNIPSRHAGAALSFDYAELRPYDPKYISGFASERYSIGIDDGWGAARASIDRDIIEGVRSQILRTHRCDVVAHISVRSSYDAVKYKLLLAPLWMSAFQYMNKTYAYLINGQTGRIAGSRPKSPLKIAILAAAAILILATIAYLSR